LVAATTRTLTRKVCPIVRIPVLAGRARAWAEVLAKNIWNFETTGRVAYDLVDETRAKEETTGGDVYQTVWQPVVFVYHCFDRVVIHGYLSGLSRPGQVVHFFRDVVGEAVIDKAVLSRRTHEYQGWVEAYARNHDIPMEWAEPKVRKEDYVRPALRRMQRANRHGVYFILKSMEQGQTFRSTVPKYATEDPNYRVLARQRCRFTHYYFYIEDEVLGPMSMRVASLFPFQATYYLNGHNFIERELNREQVTFRKNDNAFLKVSDVAALQAAADRFTAGVIQKRLDHWTLRLGPSFSKRERAAMNPSRFYAVNQVEYCRNFIFKRHFPIHKIFERSCEMGLWRMTASKISEVFGSRITKKLKGKLNTTLEQIQHGHHIFRAYWKNAFLKQYEKFFPVSAQRGVLQ
jgi:hypothetical protein